VLPLSASLLPPLAVRPPRDPAVPSESTAVPSAVPAAVAAAAAARAVERPQLDRLDRITFWAGGGHAEGALAALISDAAVVTLFVPANRPVVPAMAGGTVPPAASRALDTRVNAGGGRMGRGCVVPPPRAAGTACAPALLRLGVGFRAGAVVAQGPSPLLMSGLFAGAAVGASCAGPAVLQLAGAFDACSATCEHETSWVVLSSAPAEGEARPCCSSLFRGWLSDTPCWFAEASACVVPVGLSSSV
jgi:hypothetical protein